MSSTPSLTEFNPKHIPWQYQFVKDVRTKFDYGETFHERKVHEVMLSGSVGSAKSIALAHIAVTHCLLNKGARFGIGRLALPDLKDTLLQTILEHIDGVLIEGKHYKYTRGGKPKLTFVNGSQIICRSWHDKNFKSAFRSLALSGFGVEELTENDGDWWGFYEEMRQRINRLPHVKENIIVCATNPDSPSHPAYDYFIKGSKKHETRHVYYSITTDNPFLSKNYINQLLEDLDPLTAQRMIYGKWIHIGAKAVYHQYKPDIHFKRKKYQLDPRYPIRISFDFNIGQGKPMSAVVSQYDNAKDTFHFFDQSIIEGADTGEILKDLAERGILDHTDHKYIIHGDATGRARNPASKLSNYDVIVEFLDNYRQKGQYKLIYSIETERSNPAIRHRHNVVNGYLFNSKEQVRLYIYEDCPVLDDALTKTRLKKGGSYIEDDGPMHPYQHAGTAAGYEICYVHEHERHGKESIKFY